MLAGRSAWLNRDPIGEGGGLNLYANVGNNPVNRIDPLGLEGNPISSTLPGVSGAWNSDASGGGGSFYGPGYLAPQSPPPWYGNSPGYDPSLPSDFQPGAGGLQTDDGIFSLLAPFLAPEETGLSTCPANVSSHALRHFPTAAQDAVNLAIRNDLASLGEIAPGQSVQRTITSDGQQLTYRAFGLPNGTMNVGTAFPGTAIRNVALPRQ